MIINYARYSSFLFDESCKQNLLFLLFPVWVFMSLPMIRTLCLGMSQTREIIIESGDVYFITSISRIVARVFAIKCSTLLSVGFSLFYLVTLRHEDCEAFLHLQWWHWGSFSMQMPTQMLIHYWDHGILICYGNIYVPVCIWCLYSA